MSNIEIDGVAKVNGQLEELETRMGSPALAGFLSSRVDPYLRDRLSIRFDREGDEVVGQWRQLRERTGILRARQGFPAFHPINERTGALRRFVVSTVEVRESGKGATLTKPRRGGTAELQKKLRTAQVGGVSNSGNRFPARPVLGLGERDTEQVLNRLTAFMVEAFAEGV